MSVLHGCIALITVDWALNINYMYLSAIVAHPFFNRNKVFLFFTFQKGWKKFKNPKYVNTRTQTVAKIWYAVEMNFSFLSSILFFCLFLFFVLFCSFLKHHTNILHSACSVNRLLLCCFSGIRLIKRDIVFAASLYLWIWKTSGAVAVPGKPHTNCDLCIQKN